MKKSQEESSVATKQASLEWRTTNRKQIEASYPSLEHLSVLTATLAPKSEDANMAAKRALDLWFACRSEREESIESSVQASVKAEEKRMQEYEAAKQERQRAIPKSFAAFLNRQVPDVSFDDQRKRFSEMVEYTLRKEKWRFAGGEDAVGPINTFPKIAPKVLEEWLKAVECKVIDVQVYSLLKSIIQTWREDVGRSQSARASAKKRWSKRPPGRKMAKRIK
ncbi:hypothetical protein N8766_05435 [bacterium]|nr:hypothetical protein [bacterium]